MSDRERFDRDYIQTELQRIADTLKGDVEAYLIGGGAMSLHEPPLKTTTKDIDLVVVDEASLECLMGALEDLGYEEVTNLGAAYDELGARHCVRNDAGCQFDVFYRQIASKLLFSEGMQRRSEPLLKTSTLSVGLVSFEDIFLFKAVAERPDDIGDMATLVQTNLQFDIIESEIERQVELLDGEYFTTVISESLQRLDESQGIQTPLDEVIHPYYNRYMEGYELRVVLNEDTPKSVAELADDLGVPRTEIEDRLEYLEEYDAAERTENGICLTGKEDKFKRS